MDSPRAKWQFVVAAAVLIIGGYTVFDWTRWWAFDASVKSKVVATIGYPSVEQVLAFRGKVLEEARAYGIAESALVVDLHCERHNSKGLGLNEDPRRIFWFLVIEGRYRGRVTKWEQRLDNALPDVESEALEAAGVRIVRPEAQGG